MNRPCAELRQLTSRRWRARLGPLCLLTAMSCALPAAGEEALAQRGPQTTPSPDPRGATLYEEDNPAVTWRGPWSTNPLAVNSGGHARLAMDLGAEATFVFAGESVSWIGYRDEWSGIARVLLDGVVQTTVDTYSTPATARATLYAIDHLSSGRHELTIQPTGTHNPASAGSWVWVDAFSVAPKTPEAPAPTRGLASEDESRADRRGERHLTPRGTPGDELDKGRRFEDSDSAIDWSGSWSTNRLKVHRDGSARLSMEPSAKVTLPFTGTGISWIGYRDEWSGIADVFVDGRLRATVDTYSTPARPQAVLYTIDGLERGSHTLTIQPTGRHHKASQGSWIWVDAFSVTR